MLTVNLKKSPRHTRRKLASALAKPPEIPGMFVGLLERGSPEPPPSLNCKVGIAKTIDVKWLVFSFLPPIPQFPNCLIPGPFYILGCPKKPESRFVGAELGLVSELMDSQ